MGVATPWDWRFQTNFQESLSNVRGPQAAGSEYSNSPVTTGMTGAFLA